MRALGLAASGLCRGRGLGHHWTALVLLDGNHDYVSACTPLTVRTVIKAIGTARPSAASVAGHPG